VTIEYPIYRSARRRSLCIQVREGRVEVRAPLAMADAEIRAFVQKKSRWIQSHVAAQQAQLAEVPAYSFSPGARLPYLGGELELHWGRGLGAGSVARQGQNLLVLLGSRSRLSPEQQARRLIISWYQREALRLLEIRTQALARRLGLNCTGVKVRATRSKWGHCTRDGLIQYNWQIILAPDSVVDYLVAHEVCHLRHLNHSPAFWALVASVCPDYLRLRAWLKTEGSKLML
jgi:predicted metal-dependent hydrolase